MIVFGRDQFDLLAKFVKQMTTRARAMGGLAHAVIFQIQLRTPEPFQPECVGLVCFWDNFFAIVLM